MIGHIPVVPHYEYLPRSGNSPGRRHPSQTYSKRSSQCNGFATHSAAPGGSSAAAARRIEPGVHAIGCRQMYSSNHKLQMQISLDESRSLYDYQFYNTNATDETLLRSRSCNDKFCDVPLKLPSKGVKREKRKVTTPLFTDATRPLLLSFCEVLRPVVFSLTLCGMLTTVNFDKDIRHAMTFKMFPLKQIQLFCNTLPYCFVLLLLLWFNFGRYVAACIVASVESGNMTHIVNTIWTFLCACNAAIMFKASLKRDLLPGLFNEWFSFHKYDYHSVSAPNNDINTRNQFYTETKEWQCLRLKMRVILNMYLLWTFCAIVHNCMDIVGASAYAEVLAVPFKNVPQLGCFFFLGLNMLATAAMNLPLVIFVATCMLLCEHFRNISSQLQNCVQNEEIVMRDLEQLRMLHQYMTNTLKKADKIFSGLLLLTFTANLPLSCLSIYSLTKETGTLPIISLVVWLVVGLMNVAVVSWFAGNVVEQAHAPLQHIYNLRIPPNAPQCFALQVNLFLSKLDGGPIAFTLSSLASVTKSFAVTMAGLCLTYTAIAIQLSPYLEESKNRQGQQVQNSLDLNQTDSVSPAAQDVSIN